MSDSVIDKVDEHLRNRFGGDPAATASVTFVGLAPLEVRCYTAGVARDRAGVDGAPGPLVYFVSVGCSRDPMVDPSAIFADPVKGPRAEISVALRPEGGIPPGLYKTIAVLAAAPAVEGVVLEPDAIVDLDEPVWAGAGFTAVLLGPSGIPELPLDAPRDPVGFLEAVPITATEAAWVRVRGADALRAAWSEAGIDCHDPARAVVSL